MKPFNLEAAMRGEPIVTRDGRKAKFIAHVPDAREDQQVVFSVGGGLYVRNIKGIREVRSEVALDLFMAPPPMRSINGHEYPEPVREPLEEGQEYFLPEVFHDEIVSRSKWGSDHMDDRWLKRGLIHLTREAAEAHARAIILAGGGEV